MEHTRKSETFAVLLRFLRRYWRIPAQVAGVLGVLLVVILALPFLPRCNGKVKAASALPATGAGGSVESLLTKGVGSAFDGTVAAVLVQPGQPVKKGDLLFKMDVTEVQTELARARANVAAAQANLAQARSMMRDHVAPLRRQARQLRQQIAAEQSRTVVVPVSTPAPEEEEDAEFQAAEEIATEVVVVEPDPARMEGLRTALEAVTAQVAEESRQWIPAIRDAEQQLAAASHTVAKLRNKLAMAERHSPMDGIVTRVNFQGGQWVPARATVARVDNPDGYRVVMLVDKSTREKVVKGATVPLTVSGTPDRGQLEKVVAGWDKDLYSYWLWFKPKHPEKLRPGQPVVVDLTTTLATAAAQ